MKLKDFNKFLATKNPSALLKITYIDTTDDLNDDVGNISKMMKNAVVFIRGIFDHKNHRCIFIHSDKLSATKQKSVKDFLVSYDKCIALNQKYSEYSVFVNTADETASEDTYIFEISEDMFDTDKKGNVVIIEDVAELEDYYEVM